MTWYRFSDYMQLFFFDNVSDEHYWVVQTELRRPECESILGPLKDTKFALIFSMYYMVTTLSTVGYGDYFPTSIGEKIFAIVIMMIGVTIFATVMNNFMQMFLALTIPADRTNNEDNLTRWFSMIKRIRMQPFGEGTDISVELKEEIENHFRYFWENDRVASLLEKKQYFDSIPFRIQEHVMTQFLFSDILFRPAF